MPNCIVKGCKNQSSIVKKRDGFTFHTFPDRDQKIKKKWIAVIRQSRKELSWQPTSRSVVCSAHFKIEDFYYTAKGLRRVVKNGYPKILPNLIEGLDNEDLDQPPNVQEDPLDLSNDLDLSQPSTSCAVQTAAASDLSVLDLNQDSTTYADLTDSSNVAVDYTELPSASTAIDPDLPDSSNVVVHYTELPSASTAIDPVSPAMPKMTEEEEIMFDTPRKHKMRQKLILKDKIILNSKKKIKTLQQKIRRLEKRNKSLKNIIKKIKSL